MPSTKPTRPLLDPETNAATVWGRTVQLRKPEFAVLAPLAEQPGTVLSVADLSRLTCTKPASVIATIHRTRRSLGDRNRRLIYTVSGTDYLLNPEALKDAPGWTFPNQSYWTAERPLDAHSPDLRTIADLRISLATGAAWLGTTPLRLTPTQCTVLLRLTDQPGAITTRDALIRAALGPDMDGTKQGDYLLRTLRAALAGSKVTITTHHGIGVSIDATPARDRPTFQPRVPTPAAERPDGA